MRKLLTLGVASLAFAGCGGADGVDDHDRWVLDHPGPCDARIAEAEASIEDLRSTMKVFLLESRAEDVEGVADELRELEGVQRARAVTKDQALDRARRLFADSPGVMDNLPGNPFPASVELRIEPTRASSIERRARAIVGVGDVEREDDERAIRILQRPVDMYRDDPHLACSWLDGMELLREQAIAP